MPVVGTSHPSDAVVRAAAVQKPENGSLDAPVQVAMPLLRLLLVEEQEAFEVLRESSIKEPWFQDGLIDRFA